LDLSHWRAPPLAFIDGLTDVPQWSVMANGHSTRTVSISARSAALIEAEALLDAIGDRTRRAILLELRDGPQPVGELARRLPVGRPAVSQHLKVLKDAHLVTSRQDGTRRRYELDPAGIGALRGWLDGLWDRALDAYRVAVEQHEEGRG
jgi:DNA-binding transcriptional ArsR family regulator